MIAASSLALALSLALQGSDLAPVTGWPMLPIPEMRAADPAVRDDIDKVIADFERVCLNSQFDRGRISRDETLRYLPASRMNPRGERISLHLWRGGNRVVQLMQVDDQGMGNQCTLTVATSGRLDIKRVHGRMTARFGQQRNFRDDQATFRTADGRFTPDWIAYRAHWLGAGEPERPRIVLFAQSFEGSGALARSNGMHLVAAELTE